jgi:hypothetical protein
MPPRAGDTYFSGGDMPPRAGDTYFSGGDMPPRAGDVYFSGGDTPPRPGDAYFSGGDTPPWAGDVYFSGGDMPPRAGDVNFSGGDMPPRAGDAYFSGGDMPPQAVWPANRPVREDEPVMTALWNSTPPALWNTPGLVWAPAPLPPSNLNLKRTKKGTTMPRQRYFPTRLGDQPEWLINFADKITGYTAALNLDPGEVSDRVDDARWCAHVIGTWRINAQEFAGTINPAVTLVCSGTGAVPVVLPGFTAPALPAGVAAQLPGALDRIFRFVKDIKNAPGFNDTIGNDLDVLGPEEPEPPPGGDTPRIKLFLEQGVANQIVRLTFFKDGHQALHIECRVNGGAWVFLALDTASPYLDERPLQVPGTPEVREYRARFWDDGEVNGNWCDVAKVTVGV